MAASRTRLTRPLFGQGSRADEQGYDLSFIIGWLEDMVDYEDERAIFPDRRARLEQAEDAIELLRQVGEWTPLLTQAYKAKVKAGKAPPSARKIIPLLTPAGRLAHPARHGTLKRHLEPRTSPHRLGEV